MHPEASSSIENQRSNDDNHDKESSYRPRQRRRIATAGASSGRLTDVGARRTPTSVRNLSNGLRWRNSKAGRGVRPRIPFGEPCRLPPVNDVALSATIAATSIPSSSKICSSSIMNVLPDSVLSKCLFDGYLDSIVIVNNLSCVSKHIRSMANETVKMLDLRGLKKMQSQDVENLVSRFSNVTSLDFSYCTQFSNGHLLRLKPLSSSLRVLRLRGTSVTDDGIKEYFSTSQGKRSLEECCMLEEIDLSATTKKQSVHISDSSVQAISECCPNLNTLLLGWCSRVTDKSIQTLQNLPHLRNLDISLCEVTSQSCQTLNKMKSLKTLDVSATKVEDAGVRILITGKIDPPSCVNRTSSSTPGCHHHFCQLETLNLGFVNSLTASTLQHMVSYAPYLKSLDLSHCEDIDFSEPSIRNVVRVMKLNGTFVLKERGQPSSRN